MKKVYISLLASMLLFLVICTQYGETLYDIGKPSVSVRRASSSMGMAGTMFPAAALRSDEAGDHVFILQSERGYSRTIYTVSRVDVEIIEFNEYDDLFTAFEVKTGDRVIMDSTGPLSDGMRVVLG